MPVAGVKPARAAADAAGSGLPPGWEELIDTVSGDVYWYNEDLGETTWSRPGGPTLPAGWEQLIDDDTGDSYYYHKPTGTTSWERPT